jgi:hypothetical protein
MTQIVMRSLSLIFLFQRCSRKHLLGKRTEAHHEALFWRFNFPSGSPDKFRWTKTSVALYNLVSDPSEQKDLSKQYPERIDPLRLLWDQWIERVFGTN